MSGSAGRTPLLGLVAIAVGLVGLLVVPSVRSLGAYHEDIARAEAELARPNSGPEMIERLGARLGALERMSGDGMTPIPDEAGVATLISSLSVMLDDLGLDRREITTGKTKTHEEASSLPMSIQLEGPFLSIAGALQRVERLPRLVRVQRLRIDARQPREGALEHDVEVRADLLLEVFYAPRDVAAVDGEDG
jgi:Tfp pilus assembly protein PilO